MWGTLSVCSAGTVQNVIRGMCANSTIEVRRKTKEMPNGKACWWFVLHNDEARLQAIDAKWEHVELQTSWKLEPCFRLSTAPQVQLPAASVGHFTGDDGASAPETQATAVVFSCPSCPTTKNFDFVTNPTSNIATTTNFSIVYIATTPNTHFYP